MDLLKDYTMNLLNSNGNGILHIKEQYKTDLYLVFDQIGPKHHIKRVCPKIENRRPGKSTRLLIPGYLSTT